MSLLTAQEREEVAAAVLAADSALAANRVGSAAPARGDTVR